MTEAPTRWIGVDVGSVRVGVALTDPSGTMALPYDTVPADDAVTTILDLVAEHAAGIVVGWPLQLSGREGAATRLVEVFLQKLRTKADERQLTLVVEKRDERLTTGLAETLLDDAEVYGRRRKEVVDQVAAVEILQNFLEQSRNEPAEQE